MSGCLGGLFRRPDLLAAAAAGDADAVTRLLQRGADANCRCSQLGATPLAHAALHGHAACIKALRADGYDAHLIVGNSVDADTPSTTRLLLSVTGEKRPRASAMFTAAMGMQRSAARSTSASDATAAMPEAPEASSRSTQMPIPGAASVGRARAAPAQPAAQPPLDSWK
jgi:ankyrin repeat protein